MTTTTTTPATTDADPADAIAAADALVQNEYDSGRFTGAPLPAITDPLYALPTVAGIIRGDTFGAEILPPAPRIALISEALALAALASWMGVQTVALVAAQDDFAAVQMAAIGAQLMRDVTAGDHAAGVVRITTHEPSVFHLHATACARNLVSGCAAALPADTTLTDLADMLDEHAPGLGQWRAALSVITPRTAPVTAA
ncbi:hypothetical protein H6A71_02010 [Bifidobacterium pullorum subsp. saeculare]|uniref:hypothetical protein n=1 Tax=Bifidobacterium pullorum TaxID=78448 RepID=UPI00195E8C19|nr:hypothetical protein [Bifidobacterium pullorum]MBM6691856.1 hypothetical protein [Bifidobacterium pullorum subsp. saeculare]